MRKIRIALAALVALTLTTASLCAEDVPAIAGPPPIPGSAVKAKAPCECGVACACVECRCGEKERDYDACRQLAVKSGKPLVVWVGVQDPAREAQLTEAIHCHQNRFEDLKEPGIVVGLFQGETSRRLDLESDAPAATIRAAWRPPARAAWTVPAAFAGQPTARSGRSC